MGTIKNKNEYLEMLKKSKEKAKKGKDFELVENIERRKKELELKKQKEEAIKKGNKELVKDITIELILNSTDKQLKEIYNKIEKVESPKELRYPDPGIYKEQLRYSLRTYKEIRKNPEIHFDKLKERKTEFYQKVIENLKEKKDKTTDEYIMLADAHRETGELEEAEELNDLVIRKIEYKKGAKTFEDYINLVDAYTKKGEKEKAEKANKKATEEFEVKRLSEEALHSPLNLDIHSIVRLADSYNQLGNKILSKIFYNIAIGVADLKQDHPKFSDRGKKGHMAVAKAYKESGELEKAREFYKTKIDGLSEKREDANYQMDIATSFKELAEIQKEIILKLKDFYNQTSE